MTSSTGVSVVIPNYNGENLLDENLPSVIRALEEWGGPHEVIVVDDCSRDGSVDLIKRRFPSVRLLVNDTNRGFSRTCNRGMAEAVHPISLCINTDVRVAPDLVAPLLHPFEESTVFAVTPDILAEREGQNQGIVSGIFGKGFIKGGFAPLAARSGVRENLYAIGACVAYRMEMFRALGGYDEIYSPYLFEDVDICYRAWKRGWRSIHQPGGTVWHHNSATIGQAGKRRKRTVYFRNRFLFHWINLTDRGLVARNLLHTAVRLSVSFLWFDIPYYRAFLGALRLLGPALRRRREVTSTERLHDREILKRTAGERA